MGLPIEDATRSNCEYIKHTACRTKIALSYFWFDFVLQRFQKRMFVLDGNCLRYYDKPKVRGQTFVLEIKFTQYL